MTPNKRIKLLTDNRLIAGHVYRRDDVVEVSGERAKEFVKARAGVETEDPVTAPPSPARPRSEILAEQALHPGQANGQRATRQPARPA
jgi:hypothetical protein